MIFHFFQLLLNSFTKPFTKGALTGAPVKNQKIDFFHFLQTFSKNWDGRKASKTDLIPWLKPFFHTPIDSSQNPIFSLFQALLNSFTKSFTKGALIGPPIKNQKIDFFHFYKLSQNLRRQKGVKNWSCSVAKTIFSYPYRLVAKSNFFIFSSPSEFLY